MRFIFIFLTILLIGSSNKDNTDRITLDPNNPFNVSLNEPVDYAKVNADNLTHYVNASIANAKIDLENIKANDQLNFENLLGAMDRIRNDLSKVSSNTQLLFMVATDSSTRSAAMHGSQKLGALFSELSTDRALFKTLQNYAGSSEAKALTGNKKELLESILESYQNSAVNLNDEDVIVYKKLTEDINTLSVSYSTNMNSAVEYLVLTEKETDGLPENFKNRSRQEDGTYKIPIIPATRLVQSTAASSDVRKAYTEKTYSIAADQNLPILDSLISKRYQLGKLRGYNSYAEFILKYRMAKTSNRVWEFLNSLVDEVKPKAEKDIALLKSFRNELLNTPNDDRPIDSWDLRFYQDQLLKTKYNLDREKMRDYLPLEACLSGMLQLFQELLGFEFRKVENPSVWHQDVSMYEVYEDDKLKGLFYLDLFPRPNKESWFYGVPLKTGKQTEDGYEVPVALLLGNFTKPTADLPSLLSFGELKTLFHEFGHVMETISYDGKFTFLSSTKSDFGEAMSQMFENWVYEYDILSSFARHYQTGEVFPKPLFDRMMEVNNLFSGITLIRENLRYSLYDMNVYDKYDPNNPIDTDQLWQDIDKEMGLMNFTIKGTHPQANWIHINTNPVYYYSYAWSEVYAQDMFTVFKKNGLRDTETGIRYRKLILSNGAQRDIDEAVEAFIGRPMNNKAYIKSLGLE